MTARGNVLIVGAGIVGLSTAWALWRRGFTVEVFEQGPIPNPKASSHDEHRIIRHAYGELEGYARLMPEAFRLWDVLWGDLGVSHFEPLPMVCFMRGAGTWLEPTIRSLDALAVPWREIPVSALSARFPMIEPRGLTDIVETEAAGMLFAARILVDLAAKLASVGVRLHSESLVTDVDPDLAAATVEGRKHRGDAVVVAAGAWADRLVPELRPRAVPSRQVVMFVEPPSDLAAAWNAAPVMLDVGAEIGIYALPARRGTRTKIGDHHVTRRGDPDDERVVSDGEGARLGAAARLALRDFDRYAVLERKICFYTVTADERFIVEPCGAAGFLVSACSGHGFKLGPLIAEGVARAIAGETRRENLAAWAAGLAPP
jgi:sarcosine oxidase/sarcosine oxidase subunit beta